MTLTASHMQIAGIAVAAAVGIAACWWLVRAAMGWHSGRTLYWLGGSPDDDADGDDDDPDDHTGMDAP